MNEIRRHDRYAEEVARIREVVARHPFPDFVTGFDVELGEIDGDPTMWIFLTVSGEEKDNAELLHRVEVITEFQHAVRADLFGVFEDRFPYFRTRRDHPTNSGR